MGLHRKGKTYALWLMPEGDVYRRLARTIRRLSREHSTPTFAPHVTLASGIVAPKPEVVTKAAQLAKSLRPLRLRLTHLDSHHEYFRCLFVKVARTKALVRAHRRAKEIFGLGGRAFLPHVSLVYGDLSRAAKRRIASSLGRRFDLEFEVRRLCIVAIHGAPKAWRRVKSLRLGSA
jgi:2'-5' RNA ligase